MAALMGRRGRSVIAIERYPELHNLPRAGHIDHEVVRTVQQVGDVEALVDTMWEVRDDYMWLNGQGELLMLQPLDLATSVSGWYADYTLYQPNLERAMHEAALESGVEVLFGWDVVSVRSHDDHVEVCCNRVSYGEDGERIRSEEYRTIQARYAVGADGASSFTRTTLGIPREDFGFNERWLDIDMKTLKPHKFSPNIAQIADPARPRMLMPLGKGHRRFEWMVMDGETDELMERPETGWELLSEWDVTPETHEIARQIVYHFQARIAERWRRGRVFLAGDAAHTMPPYAGQGVCSSIRDVNNLAWKLDLVLDGLAPDTILDSYELERRAHVTDWTRISLAEGEVSCVTDPVVAAERDKRLLSGEPLPIPHFPTLRDGLLIHGPDSDVVPPVGTLGLQGRVRYRGREGLFDDLLGHSRFQLISRAGDPFSRLSEGEREFLAKLGAIVAEVVPPASDADPDAVVDIDGAYARYFDEYGLDAVLNRPDFYVFGGVESIDSLGSLVQALKDALVSPSPVAVVEAR